MANGPISAEMPSELRAALGGEAPDFAVKAERKAPRGVAIGLLVFAIFWDLMTFLTLFTFVNTVMTKGEIKVDGIPTPVGPGHWDAAVVPGIVFLVFIAIGLFLIVHAVRMLVASGDWFVGTPQRMIVWSPRSVRSIDWDQFTGDIELRGSGDRGDITLKLRMPTDIFQNRSQSPHTVYLAGVPDPFRLEGILRRRIKENDPTPSALTS